MKKVEQITYRKTLGLKVRGLSSYKSLSLPFSSCLVSSSISVPFVDLLEVSIYSQALQQIHKYVYIYICMYAINKELLP